MPEEGHPLGDPSVCWQGSEAESELPVFLFSVLPEQESEDTSEDSLVAVAAADIAETADMPEQESAASVAQGIPP